MKRLFYLLLITGFLFAFTACGGGASQETDTEGSEATEETSTDATEEDATEEDATEEEDDDEESEEESSDESQN